MNVSKIVVQIIHICTERNAIQDVQWIKGFLQKTIKHAYDCPKQKPYYNITGTDPDFQYECVNSCKAYIENPDKNMNAKKCLLECNNNQYYIEIGTGEQSQHICYRECPSTHPFQDDKQCLTECPESKLHYPDEYKCISYQECESKIIKYDENQCVERCSEAIISMKKLLVII